MIEVGSFKQSTKISYIIDAAIDKIEYDLNNNNLAPHLDGITIQFVTSSPDNDRITLGYSKKFNGVRVFLCIPYSKTLEIIEKEGEEVALMYIYNRLLKGINKIDLTCKRWVTPDPRKKV